MDAGAGAGRPGPRPRQASPAAVPPPATATPQSYPPEQVRAGQPIFSAQCGFCHGRDAMGGETGPDLTRARERRGRRARRQDRPARAQRPRRQGHAGFTLGDADLAAVVAFIHDQKTKAESLTGGRRAVDVADLQTGNAEAGQDVLRGRLREVPFADAAISPASPNGCRGSRCCSACCTRPAPRPRSRAKVTVTRPSGETVTGTLAYRDEFTIALTDASGAYRAFPTRPGEVHRRRSAPGSRRAARKVHR